MSLPMIKKLVCVFSMIWAFNFSSHSIAADYYEEYLRDMSSLDNRGVFVRAYEGLYGLMFEPIEVLQRTYRGHLEFPRTIRNPFGETQGLLVMVHGLNAQPVQFWSYIENLPSTLENWSLYTPAVIERGNAHLDEAVDPIFNEITEWATQHPNLPIILIGTSNGGRIVLEISNRLSTNNPILLVSLAGAIGGSGTLAFFENLRLAQYFIPQPVRMELISSSDRAQRLIHEARTRAFHGNIHYIFIGASEDQLLFDRSMAFPNMGLTDDDVRNILLRRTAHSGMVSTSQPIVYLLIEEWINSKTISKTQLHSFSFVLSLPPN